MLNFILGGCFFFFLNKFYKKLERQGARWQSFRARNNRTSSTRAAGTTQEGCARAAAARSSARATRRAQGRNVGVGRQRRLCADYVDDDQCRKVHWQVRADDAHTGSDRLSDLPGHRSVVRFLRK